MLRKLKSIFKSIFRFKISSESNANKSMFPILRDTNQSNHHSFAHRKHPCKIKHKNNHHSSARRKKRGKSILKTGKNVSLFKAVNSSKSKKGDTSKLKKIKKEENMSHKNEKNTNAKDKDKYKKNSDKKACYEMDCDCHVEASKLYTEFFDKMLDTHKNKMDFESAEETLKQMEKIADAELKKELDAMNLMAMINEREKISELVFLKQMTEYRECRFDETKHTMAELGKVACIKESVAIKEHDALFEIAQIKDTEKLHMYEEMRKIDAARAIEMAKEKTRLSEMSRVREVEEWERLKNIDTLYCNDYQRQLMHLTRNSRQSREKYIRELQFRGDAARIKELEWRKGTAHQRGKERVAAVDAEVERQMLLVQAETAAKELLVKTIAATDKGCDTKFLF